MLTIIFKGSVKICKSVCRVKHHLFIQDKFPYILISTTRQQHCPGYMSYIREINIEKSHPGGTHMTITNFIIRCYKYKQNINTQKMSSHSSHK